MWWGWVCINRSTVQPSFRAKMLHLKFQNYNLISISDIRQSFRAAGRQKVHFNARLWHTRSPQRVAIVTTPYSHSATPLCVRRARFPQSVARPQDTVTFHHTFVRIVRPTSTISAEGSSGTKDFAFRHAFSVRPARSAEKVTFRNPPPGCRCRLSF